MDQLPDSEKGTTSRCFYTHGEVGVAGTANQHGVRVSQGKLVLSHQGLAVL